MSYDWIKSIDNYIGHFSEDHQLIIRLIGIENYLTLYEYFGKTGIYFPARRADIEGSDCSKIIELIGEENYDKLFTHFGKAGIYFGSVSINSLKRAWAIKNKHIDYNEAARTLDVAAKTIYRWRQERVVKV